MKIITIGLLLFMSSFLGRSQELTYKSGGKVLDATGAKLSPTKVKDIVALQPFLLTRYDDARGQKTLGNILLHAGIASVLTDLVKGSQYSTVYPSAFTYIGLGAIVLSFPIKSGYSKSIKNVVGDYNSSLKENKVGFKIEKINAIADKNGVGFKTEF
jgi:hypothetical protein